MFDEALEIALACIAPHASADVFDAAEIVQPAAVQIDAYTGAVIEGDFDTVPTNIDFEA